MEVGELKKVPLRVAEHAVGRSPLHTGCFGIRLPQDLPHVGTSRSEPRGRPAESRLALPFPAGPPHKLGGDPGEDAALEVLVP